MSRKRRSRVRPPRDAESPAGRAKPPSDTLHDGKFTAGFPPPNHLLPLGVLRLAQVQVDSMHKLRWPLSQAQSPEDAHQPLFIDPQHLGGGNYYSGNEPPTWMDPHLLVQMAMRRPETTQLLERAFSANKLSRPLAELQELLRKVFEEDYMPYLFQHFWGFPSELIARWMLVTYADQRLHEPKRRKKSHDVAHEETGAASSEV